MANGGPETGDGSGGDSVLSDWTTPANDDPSAPRAVTLLAALAVYGFHTALAGGPLFGRPLLDD